MLSWFVGSLVPLFFFFNDTATTEIYTLSLHDALPIYPLRGVAPPRDVADLRSRMLELRSEEGDPVPGPFHGGFLGAFAYDLGVAGERAVAAGRDPWGSPLVAGGLYVDFIARDEERDAAW